MSIFITFSRTVRHGFDESIEIRRVGNVGRKTVSSIGYRVYSEERKRNARKNTNAKDANTVMSDKDKMWFINSLPVTRSTSRRKY